MLCQSCGSNIHIGMNQCPSCGEEVITALTAALPQKASKTGQLDYASAFGDSAPAVAAKAVSVEHRSNGRVSEPVPSAVRPVMPPPPPALPIVEPRVEPKVESKVEPKKEKNETNGRVPLPIQEPVSDALPSSGVYCRRCRRELKVGAKFCSSCGASSEPSALTRGLALSKTYAIKMFISLRESFARSTMSAATILMIGFSILFALTALIQYLIPIEVDSGSSTQLIYHLRSIEFLLAALIFMVAGLLFNKNR